MKKHIIYILICLVAFCSCNQKDEESRIWGQIDYYNPFLWHKYVPDTLRKTLAYEFNENSSDLDKPVVFSLYLVSDDGEKNIKADNSGVELYVNGKLSADNTFELIPQSGKHEVDFGIVLKENLLFEKDIDRDYQFVFKVESNPGIDRINNFKIGNLKRDKAILLPENDDKTPILIRVKHIANSLKVGTLSTLFTILTLILAFIIIVQIFTKRFNKLQIGKIFVTIDGNRKNISRMEPMQKLKLSKEIVLTPNRQKQGFLKMLFTGKITYVFIKGLPSDIKMTPGNKAQTIVTCRRNEFEISTSGDNDELKVMKYCNKDDNSVIEVEYCTKRR